MSDSKAAATVSGKNDPETIDEHEYRALETVLTQTARGRAFLREHLSRNGSGAATVSEQPLPASDTTRILAAIGELHEAIREQQNQPSVAHVRMDILEMARAISRTRAEIAALRTQGSSDQLVAASEEMDAIVSSTERATNDILQNAERIQELAWQLREGGADSSLCENIDDCVTEIYTSCSFQDLTGQRTTKVVRVLQYLEARINSMIEIWGLSVEGTAQQRDTEAAAASHNHHEHVAVPELPEDQRPDSHLLNGPQMDAHALGQDNIDELMGGFDALIVEPDAEQEADDAFAVAEASLQAAADDNPLEQAETAADAAFDALNADEEIDEETLKALFS